MLEIQGDRTKEEAAWASRRALLDRQYEDALRSGLARAPSTLPPDASEEDILAEATRITRRR